jgi:AsmA protein
LQPERLFTAIGVKQIAILIACVVAIGILVIAAAIHVVPGDSVREAVASEIRAVTGFDPLLHGPVSVSMFPAPTVEFSDVTLNEPVAGETAFAVEQLIVNLRVVPLLAGRIEIADISLTKPRIAVTIHSDGHTNWSPLIDILARALRPNAKHDDKVLSFSEIRINDGVITVRAPSRDVYETLEGVELSLAWPSIAKSFAATGHFSWHNETVDTSLAIADFPGALTGGDSGLKFRLIAGPFKAAFDGAMSYEPSLKIDGTLAADTSSLREALRWRGDQSLPADGLAGFALKAHAAVNGRAIALSNLNVELDGNVAEGVLSYGTTGRQILQGTLAVDKLDLGPYVSAFRLIADNTRDWDQRALMLDWFNGWDLDLRVSAARVQFAHVELGRTAIAANMRAGRLLVTIGESQAFNGAVTGTVAVGKSEAGAEFSSQMQFSNVDLEKCLGELFGMQRLEGSGSVAFSIDSTGHNVQELAGNLNGTVQVTAKQGALNGWNVEQMMRRLQRSPLSANSDFRNGRNGRTPFDKLNIGLRIDQGIAKIEDVELEGSSIRLALTGTTSIPQREFDLAGTANLITGAASDANASFALPFTVRGQWGSPLIMPDTRTLIQRSPATAPLLGAVPDKDKRDAVQGAINRLTGGSAAPFRPAR